MNLSQAMIANLEKLKQQRFGHSGWKYTYPEWSSEQLKFLQCPDKKLLLRAPRRAGKTVALAERMLMEANTPAVIDGQEIYAGVIYICMTKHEAKAIIWKELKQMCQLRGLVNTTNEVELRMVFPSGGFIEIQGAGLSDSANKARGRKIKMLCIDEAAFISSLKEIVAIWTPTLADYQGSIVLSCSPGKSPTGFFYEADLGANKEYWTQFYLNPDDNPAFKNGRYQQFKHEQLRTLYGSNEQHPEYQREWEGKWVHDVSNLLFKYDPGRNFVEQPHEIDHTKFEYILGLDIGYLDSTAITVIANHRFEPWCMYVDEFSKAEMRISEIVSTVQLYAEKYRTACTVVDSGGMGKHSHIELQNHAEIGAVVAAYKYNKKVNIELLNNDLYAGRVKVNKSCPKIIEAWSKILKTADGKEDDKVDYGSNYVIDIADSALYGHTYTHPTMIEKITGDKGFGDPIKDKKYEKYRKQKEELERYGLGEILKP